MSASTSASLSTSRSVSTSVSTSASLSASRSLSTSRSVSTSVSISKSISTSTATKDAATLAKIKSSYKLRTELAIGPGGMPGGSNIFLDFKVAGKTHSVVAGPNYRIYVGKVGNNVYVSPTGAKTATLASPPTMQTELNNATSLSAAKAIFSKYGLLAIYNALVA